LEQVAVLLLATAWISFTLSESALFAPARGWLAARSSWLGKLVNCGYCTGFWVAVALVSLCQPRVCEVWAPLDYLLSAIVVAWLAAFQWALLCWLMQRLEK
jgi:hypothetical protein